MHPIYFFRKLIDKFSLLPKNKECLLCKNKVFNFLPLPDYYMKNFKKFGFPHTKKGDFESINTDLFFCPRCYSLDRERLYAWYMKKFVPLTENQTILDFAPSKGLSQWIKSSYHCKYVTADLYMDNVDVKTDIENMSVFKDESFDFVICSHVMEHVSNDKLAMKEIHRVLKKSGTAIIMTPILRNFEGIDEDINCSDISERWRRFGQDDHVRLYSQKVFSKRLEEAGFQLNIFTGNEINKRDIIQFGLPENIFLYIVKK